MKLYFDKQGQIAVNLSKREVTVLTEASDIAKLLAKVDKDTGPKLVESLGNVLAAWDDATDRPTVAEAATDEG